MTDVFTGEFDSAGDDYDQWTSVTFTRDFGPWKKGDSIDILAVTAEEFLEYDHLGNIVQKCKYRIEAVEC